MDIHKPKPWHGVREFLKEYVIIVVGVLTALGAEAVVARMHEYRISDEARAAILTELDQNLANQKRRQFAQACIDQKLAAISDVLTKAERSAPFQPIGYVGRPPIGIVATQRWEAATSGGRTTLLSQDEQGRFAEAYRQLMRTETREYDEERAWSHLAALEGSAHLAPEAVVRAKEALGEARTQDFMIRRDLSQISVMAERIGVRGDKTLSQFNRGKMASVCVPIATPHAQAAAMTQDPNGAP